MQLTQVEEGFSTRWVLHGEREEPLGSLLELRLVLRLLTVVEVRAGQVEHTLVISLFCSFFIQDEGLVQILLHAVTKFIADTQVVQRSCAALCRCLFEPLSGLIVVFQFVIENGTEGIHRKDISFCLGLIVVADSSLDVLLGA